MQLAKLVRNGPSISAAGLLMLCFEVAQSFIYPADLAMRPALDAVQTTQALERRDRDVHCLLFGGSDAHAKMSNIFINTRRAISSEPHTAVLYHIIPRKQSMAHVGLSAYVLPTRTWLQVA